MNRTDTLTARFAAHMDVFRNVALSVLADFARAA